jgi:hypothetical protein
MSILSLFIELIISKDILGKIKKSAFNISKRFRQLAVVTSTFFKLRVANQKL